MERSINTNALAADIPQDEVFSRACLFFEEFPRDIWLPAIWKIMEGYRTPRYETREQMLHDENVQILIYLIDFLDDVEPRCARALDDKRHPPVPDISPRNSAA